MSKSASAEVKLDYRERYKGVKQALNYEYSLHADKSAAPYIWEIEKSILLKEVSLIRKNEIKYLDFACGTGRILSFLEQYVSESTGIDISENMTELGKSKTKKSLLLNCDLTKNDIIGNKQYDLITAFRFFLNAQEDLRKEVLLLLSEKLSNDGIFIFNTHGNTLGPYLLSVILRRLKKKKLNHLSYFKALKLIRSSKLKLKKVYGIGFIPSSFYRWFKPWRKFFMNIDKILPNFIFLKYFARNLIFVCTKDK